MGITTTQNGEGSGNDCECWEPGKTPKVIYGSFSNIKRSPLNPVWKIPWPNLVFKLTQTASVCSFTGSMGDWVCSYWGSPIQSSLQLRWRDMWWGFDGLHDDICIFYFPNKFINPAANMFTGGAGAISWVTPLI